MADPVLATTAALLCAHGGQARVGSVAVRVRLGGSPTLLAGPPAVVNGCTNPYPPNGVGPCATAPFATASIRVRAQGRPILLGSSSAVCAPTGTPLRPVPGQTRVRGV